jgi:NADH-quinone oxidoreductase subunit C
MGLSYKEVYDRIQASFADAVVSRSEGPVDPFLVVKKEHLVKLCTWLREDAELRFDFLSSVSGVDDTQTFWSVYHIYSIPKNHNCVLKVDCGKEDPWVPSVCGVWATANWHEREAYDLYGIRYEGHPDLRRILLPEDWEGHPLRKDYDFPEEYRGIPLR